MTRVSVPDSAHFGAKTKALGSFTVSAVKTLREKI